MKIFLLLLLVGIGNHAMAAEEASISAKFHFLSTKCEPESSDGPEVSPQSPPLDVDDPGTPGCNRWEINILADGDFTKGERHLETPLLDLNYGIGDNVQLKYEVPMEQNHTEEHDQSAVGRSKVGVKYLFFSDEEAKTEIAVYPQIDMATPGVRSSSDQTETSNGSVVTLPILYSQKVGSLPKGDVMLTANVGYNFSSRSDVQNFVSCATGVGMPLGKTTSLMGEVSAEEAVTKNDDGVREELVKVNAGIMQGLSKQVLLYGSVGESLVSSDHLNHTYALLGFRYLPNN